MLRNIIFQIIGFYSFANCRLFISAICSFTYWQYSFLVGNPGIGDNYFYYYAFFIFESENKRNFLFIDLFLYWIIFSAIRGIFMAENYWDYKSLIIRIFEILLIFIAYIASNKEINCNQCFHFT
jgi:hypothetical protein